MLDVKTKLVLKILNKECHGGGYKVVEKADIISALPAKFRCDSDELEHIMTYLERHDCISIKYDDESVYCIAILPTTADVLEDAPKKKAELPPFFWAILFLIVLLASFISSLSAVFLQKVV